MYPTLTNSKHCEFIQKTSLTPRNEWHICKPKDQTPGLPGSVMIRKAFKKVFCARMILKANIHNHLFLAAEKKSWIVGARKSHGETRTNPTPSFPAFMGAWDNITIIPIIKGSTLPPSSLGPILLKEFCWKHVSTSILENFSILHTNIFNPPWHVLKNRPPHHNPCTFNTISLVSSRPTWSQLA